MIKGSIQEEDITVICPQFRVGMLVIASQGNASLYEVFVQTHIPTGLLGSLW